MEYINDINIQEAVINVLDNNGAEPILNEFTLELTEDTYKFLYKHIEKCLKDEELKTAVFNPERNIVREITKDYLNGMDKDFIELSKELSKQLFSIMKCNCNIPSCDFITVSLITDIGPLIGILKMDYVNTFTHQIDIFDNKIAVGLLKHGLTLPGSSQKIQKAAFVKPTREKAKCDLYILDKIKNVQSDDEYGINYWTNSFLNSCIVTNERDNTKVFMRASETWIRNNLIEDAEKAEKIRREIKEKLVTEDNINVEEVAENLLGPGQKEDYRMFMARNCDEEFTIDKKYVEKKLKRVRLKIDKDIDLYINQEAYKDASKFEIQRNGDGSINMIIKNVVNYIEK